MANRPIPTERAGVDECRRCGTCCRKGGPTLHWPDRHLVETGRLPLNVLYTLRSGEWVHDPIHGGRRPLTGELIKIKGAGKSWACTYFDTDAGACRNYEHRPLECRCLKCWDTTAIAAVSERDLLTRKDLFAKVDGLWELIEAHERICDCRQLAASIQELRRTADPDLAVRIVETIDYDAELRKAVAGKKLAESAALDVLFGRPLHKTLHQFGIAIRKQGGKRVMVPVNPLRQR
jgi:Fe-S-cluster containining protein